MCKRVAIKDTQGIIFDRRIVTCYNDHDRDTCRWLPELSRLGAISVGVVDNRPIQEIQPDDIRDYRRVHLFAGIGRLCGYGNAIAPQVAAAFVREVMEAMQ